LSFRTGGNGGGGGGGGGGGEFARAADAADTQYIVNSSADARFFR
jgi:hypothetical protein